MPDRCLFVELAKITPCTTSLTLESRRPIKTLWPTAFYEAARWGHLGIVQELLAEGIDVDVRSEHGSTALIHASSAGQLPIVRALLAAGANVNTLGNKCTPLIANLSALHSERTYLAICNELLNAGADSSICDNEGRSALHWAESRQFESLTNLIRNCPRGE